MERPGTGDQRSAEIRDAVRNADEISALLYRVDQLEYRLYGKYTNREINLDVLNMLVNLRAMSAVLWWVLERPPKLSREKWPSGMLPLVEGLDAIEKFIADGS